MAWTGDDPNLDPADRPPLIVQFVECPECGGAVAVKWTPDGVEEVAGCAQHD